MSIETDKMIIEAEYKIAKILENLELKTNALVDDIEIKDIEITTISDDRPQWMRRIILHMKCAPGSRWANHER